MVNVEDDAHFLARLKRATDDALVIGRKLRISLAIVHGVNAIEVLWRIDSVGDVSKVERF